MSMTHSPVIVNQSSPDFWRLSHFLKQWHILWPLIILFAIVLLALFGDQFGHSADMLDDMHILSKPSLDHLLGTDDMGRDTLSRLAFGARISLIIGLSTALFSTSIGTLYGVTSALSPQWLDNMMNRGMDILYSLPFLMIVVVFKLIITPWLEALQHLFPQFPFLQVAASIIATILAIAFFSWTDTARLIRAESKKILQEEFIEAAQNIGTPPIKLFMKHLLPNLGRYLLLSATITIPRAILTEATLSFLGLGIQPPWCTWGTMILDGWQMIRIAPMLLIWPSVCLIASVASLNQFSEAFKEKYRI